MNKKTDICNIAYLVVALLIIICLFVAILSPIWLPLVDHSKPVVCTAWYDLARDMVIQNCE